MKPLYFALGFLFIAGCTPEKGNDQLIGSWEYSFRESTTPHGESYIARAVFTIYPDGRWDTKRFLANGKAWGSYSGTYTLGRMNSRTLRRIVAGGRPGTAFTGVSGRASQHCFVDDLEQVHALKIPGSGAAPQLWPKTVLCGASQGTGPRDSVTDEVDCPVHGEPAQQDVPVRQPLLLPL